MDIDGLMIGKNNPVRVMGIINLSSESFYASSVVSDEIDLQDRIRFMELYGADIIDVGGASTAPIAVYGTEPINENEELERVESYIGKITDITDLPISIDTVSSKVAETALDLGASIVNDVSGLKSDKRMADLVADRDVPIILMANCAKGCQTIDMSLGALQKSIRIACDSGIGQDRIILDPGIGFGKPPEVDFAILRELHRYASLNYPLLVGVSRKAFIGSLMESPEPDNRLVGTIAATSIAVSNGADIIRTHDVPEAVIACRIGEAVRKNLS